ncbi:unnamed protein product [Alopecurus aequalis]
MGLCLGKAPGGGHTSPPPCWPDLPPEIAGLVLSRLASHEDRLTFAAVCPEWRLAAAQVRMLLPPANPCINLDNGAYQNIADGKVRRFITASGGGVVDASYGGWLLVEDEGSIGCSLHDPFSTSTTDTIQVPCRYYNQRNNYTILDQSSPSTMHGERGRYDVVGNCDPLRRPFSVQKLVILSPHLGVAMFKGSPFMAAPINFACFKSGSSAWSHPNPTSGFLRHALLDFIYTDIEFHRGKIFALGGMGHLFAHELIPGEEPSLGPGQQVIREQPDAAFLLNANYHLVGSADKQKLLMVRWSVQTFMNGIKIDHPSVCLHVFEADLDMGRWSEVKDLGNQVIFVGRTGSKALTVTCSSDHYHQRFGGGNRVFLLGDEWAWAGAWTRDECTYCEYLDCRNHINNFPNYCVYDMVSRKTSLVFLTNGSSSIKHFRSEWFFPSM